MEVGNQLRPQQNDAWNPWGEDTAVTIASKHETLQLVPPPPRADTATPLLLHCPVVTKILTPSTAPATHHQNQFSATLLQSPGWVWIWLVELGPWAYILTGKATSCQWVLAWDLGSTWGTPRHGQEIEILGNQQRWLRPTVVFPFAFFIRVSQLKKHRKCLLGWSQSTERIPKS